MGVGDTVDGTLDVFMQEMAGIDYHELPDHWKESLDPLKGYSSYTELSFNSAWTESSRVEVDIDDDGTLRLNPMAMREVRYATNWLISREYMVEEAHHGYGKPQYESIGVVNPSYDEHIRPVVEEHGITYQGDFDHAYNMIQDAMTEAMNDPDLAGEMRPPSESPSQFWQYKPPGEDWDDISITGLIRVEDERLEIGRTFSDLLEECGIKVIRNEGERELINIWLFTDPADFEWGFYTGS